MSLGDEIAGLHAVIGALLALRARDRDGVGDHVDVSLVESSFALTEGLLPEYVHAGMVTERAGNRYLRAAPSGTYETRDGKYLSIAGNSEPIFARLCKLVGQEGLARDPRFSSNGARVENGAERDQILAQWSQTVDLEGAVLALAAAGVPAGPVYSIADIAAAPHFRARGTIAEVSGVATPGVMPRLRRTPGRLSHAAKAVGADHERVVGAPRTRS